MYNVINMSLLYASINYRLKRMEDRVNTVEKEKLELHELVGFEKENTVILEKR